MAIGTKQLLGMGELLMDWLEYSVLNYYGYAEDDLMMMIDANCISCGNRIKHHSEKQSYKCEAKFLKEVKQ